MEMFTRAVTISLLTKTAANQCDLRLQAGRHRPRPRCLAGGCATPTAGCLVGSCSGGRWRDCPVGRCCVDSLAWSARVFAHCRISPAAWRVRRAAWTFPGGRGSHAVHRDLRSAERPNASEEETWRRSPFNDRREDNEMGLLKFRTGWYARSRFASSGPGSRP